MLLQSKNEDRERGKHFAVNYREVNLRWKFFEMVKLCLLQLCKHTRQKRKRSLLSVICIMRIW